VTLSPLAQNKIAQFIERKINNPEIHVTATNQKFILEGVANDPNEKARAEILAKMYVPDVVVDEAVADKKVLERKADVVINLITVRKAPESPPPKIIQMVVHYVELQKEYTKGFRFQWTPTIGEESQIQFSSGGRAPGGVLATITGTISNLFAKTQLGQATWGCTGSPELESDCRRWQARHNQLDDQVALPSCERSGSTFY
jgi:pilus assembly protein CpaC